MSGARNMSNTEVIESAAPCSWCEAETGVRTQGSHGICDRHQVQVAAEWQAHKVATLHRTTRIALEGAAGKLAIVSQEAA